MLGIPANDVASAVRDDLRVEVSALRAFALEASEDAKTLVCSWDSEGLQFGRELPRSASHGFVVLARKRGAETLAVAMEKDNPAAELASSVDVVFATSGETAGGRGPLLNAARRLVSGALRPLLEEASAAENPQQQDDEKKNNHSQQGQAMAGGTTNINKPLLALHQRLRDFEFALATCDARAKLPEAKLVPPASVIEALKRTTEDDDEALAELVKGKEAAEACASSVARWARQAHELAALVETASEPTSTLAFPRGGRLEVEIGLWRDYEAALRQAAAERTSRAARCMSAALKRSKRFVAAAQLEDGVASLSRAVDIAQDAMKILGDLPVTRIEAASDLSPELADATEKFFQHMFKIKAARHYPIRRASMVVESASMAIGSRAARLLADADPLALTQRDCAKVLDDADAVFDAARSGIRRFRQNAAELSKLDAVGVLFHKDLVLPHEAVENRIEEIRQFRKTHDALRAALAAVLRDDDDNDGSIVAPRLDSQPSSPTGGTSIVATDSRDALGELDAAYARFAKQTTSSGGRDELPTLVDSTAEGSALWRSALDDYGRRVNKAEGLAAARLAARLDAAQSADDTFAVFARFQPLLDRALVRRAAQRHQASLIEHVRADVEALRDACTKRYEGSNAEAVSIARHAPTLASKIVWAKQVERRLLRQMARLRDVLGGQDNADRHPSGRALKTVADELLRHLDAQPLYDAWLDDWKKRSVVKQQSVGSSKRQLYRSLLLHIDDEERYLVVSFDESRASLSKEVRQLRWLGFRVPETIALIAEEARERYPIAVALDAAARSYAVASDTARQTNRSSFVVPWVKAVRDRVGLAFPRRSSNANKLQAPRVSWTSPLQSVRVYVDAFAEDVAALQEKLDVLQDASDQFKRAADALAEDGGNSPSGTHIENDLLSQHAKLQDIIDRLSLEGFEALEEWTRDAQATALTALRDRLSKRLVRIFIQGDFSNSGKIVSHHTLSVVGEGPSTRVDVEPSLPEARRRWYDLLAAEVEVAACLPKLRASRFDALDGADDAGSIIYGESLYRCSREEHDGLVSALEAVVGKIEEAATTARDRVGAWTQHLVIWRKSVADLAQSLDYGDGDDNKDVASSALERWTTTTRDAIRARASLDQLFVEEDERREALSAGECSVAAAIDARPAKERMRPRFDAWLRELRDEHSTRVAAISTKTHEALRTARDDLEQVDARSCPCRIALETMARCTELKSGRDETLRVIEAIENADSVITSRSDDWLEASRVRGAFEDLDQLLDRKAEALKQRRSVLSGDLDRELDRAARTAARLSDRWRRLRPERLADTLSNGVEETPSASDPQHALEALATFRTEIEKSKSDVDSLERAGSALLSQQQESPTKHIALELETIANRELPALVEVWERVSPAVDACTRFDVTRWSAFDPDAERESLRDASEDLTNKSPARVRQYMVFADAQAAVGLRERALAILGDIKRAPKLSETAWDKIASTLAGVPRWDPSTQKLGTLVKKCQEPDAKNVVEAVLASARADAALSDFLDELHHYWETAGLEVVSGENEEETSEPRRRLIKGWDALFAKLDEDSTGLRAMKQSPHFRRAIADGGHVEIAARRDELEVRCDELRRRLELWADAQRRWVHLDAVRSSIGRRLPAAAAKLAEADRLFSIARSETLIGDNPAVKLVLVSHKLPDQLTAVSNLLADAQQALGEYLESCRSKFARFYFVGDEDLLSILGASGSAVGGALSPHLGKLFQALDAIVETDDSSVAMRSPDGLELVKLDDSFALSTTANGDDEESEAVGWLRSLERAMQVAVARDSAEAVDSFPSNKSEDVEKWFSTRTAQAVMLGVDVRWVKEVESGMMSKAPESSLDEVRSRVRSRLAGLCVAPAAATAVETRKRELCIVEFSRQRDVMDSLVSGKVSDVADWSWARLVKMYAGTSLKDAVGDATLVDECVEGVNGLVAVGRCVDAALSYGWEYQGVGARLVRTPLTDRCFVTLAQALRLRLGASPVGPAGTGKTESVKAFGTLLGRLVVCFNCDESYSVAAMRRLLRGTCATGAFACFDELNRLSEGMLSAVSEMVRVIQLAQQQKDSVVALGSSKSTGGIPLKPTSAVFITLNPSYAGRSPLPETLKSLFRYAHISHFLSRSFSVVGKSPW